MSKPRLLWTNIIFFVITTSITLIAVPLYAVLEGYSSAQIVAAVLLLGFAGMSITMGYHRLWSHRTFEAHPAIRVLLALGGAMAVQNSILHWSSDHRNHHRFVDDNQKDPYSARRGFWYSHIGWMIREYQQDSYNDYSNVKDLQNDPVVRWQHKYYWKLAWGVNFLVTGVIGIALGDLIGTLLLAGVARLTISQHFTFFINSLAHIWGSQPYSDECTARDNRVLALVTYGEGYHNFHHRFASDYRNGIRWWQFDPTKWAIKSLSWVGLTRNLKRYSDERIEKARALMQMKIAQTRLQNIGNAKPLLNRLQQEYDALLKRMNEFSEAKRRWLDNKRSAMPSVDAELLHKQYKELKANWKNQRKQWRDFIKMQVMSRAGGGNLYSA